MIKRLNKILQSEDKKNPFTDDQLAELLKIQRERVTMLRKNYNIPNSRERRNIFLINDLEEIISQNPEISNVDLTAKIKERGYSISRFVVSQLRGEIGESFKNSEMSEIKFKDQRDNISGKDSDLAFETIIGSNGSLKPQIHQAKAAVLYPPHGLHTLIIGPTGVGKSILAEAMHHFAIVSERFSATCPFIVFNCADYAENPQLLLSQLFGHTKGAFTGAEVAKEGLVNKADGGMLFLDEVHRLPPEGQELLFSLIDKGKYRRLGETENERTSRVMIIAATTEDIESSLLITFRRRIPMVVELPSLSTRPLVERFKIVKDFFEKESNRVGIRIKVTQQALRALLIYDCPGNIGQLRSDIQVACARGFLNYIGDQNKYIEIDLMDLPSYARRGLLRIRYTNLDIENLLKHDFIVAPGEIENKVFYKENFYIMPQETYQYIEEKYKELESQGLAREAINRVIGGELEIKLHKFIQSFENNHQLLSKNELVGILGQKIVDISFDMTKIAEHRLGKVDNHLFYCLAIHLNAALERIQQGKPIINPELDKVKRQYNFEFQIAKEMIETVQNSYDIIMPEDEIGFIAMYLRMITHPENIKKGRVKVIVITHGNVAQSMTDVANRLLGVNNAYAINMSLDEKPEAALKKTIELAKKIDEGKGILLLVDMGSLTTFGEIITERTGIPAKVLNRVDTIMVLEAVRKSLLPDSNLNDIANSISTDKSYSGGSTPKQVREVGKKIILTICITGSGAAFEVKNILEKEIPELIKTVDIQPIGVMGNDINKKIEKIKQERDVIAIVGTLDPKDRDIPFVSMEELIDGSGVNRIRKIMGVNTNSADNNNSFKALSEIIHDDTILIKPRYNHKSEILEGLAGVLLQGGYVNEKFIYDIYKREALGSTLVNNSVSIPHGHPNNVITPAIAISTFEEPVIWYAENKVDLVFMLALKEDCTEIIGGLDLIIKNESLLSQIKSAGTPLDIKILFGKNITKLTNVNLV